MKRKPNQKKPLALPPQSATVPAPASGAGEAPAPFKPGLDRRPDGQSVFGIPHSTDSEGQQQWSKAAFVDLLGARVVASQASWMVKDECGGDATRAFVGALKQTVGAKDALEEMLLVQMAWTHMRLAKLSWLANQQQSAKNIQVVNDACDRAANSFRRQLLALADYRRPPRTDAFYAIKQANLAQQQVVQNNSNPNWNAKTENGNAPNEQGCVAAPQDAAALPALPAGARLPPVLGPAQPALAPEHRPQVGPGQGQVVPQRLEARGAVGGGHGTAAADGEAAPDAARALAGGRTSRDPRRRHG